MSKPHGRYACRPGGEFTMLVATEAQSGERIYVEFMNFPDADDRQTTIHSQAAEECKEGQGPHHARIPVPADTPLGEYQLTTLSLLRGDDVTASFADDELRDIWLTVGEAVGPLTPASVLRFTRSE